MRLAEVLAVVGLEVSARVYPTGQPLRDAAHLRLLARLRHATAPSFRWQHEVPLPLPGDLRAWDAVLTSGAGRVAVEAETRPRDLQALRRRLALKQRDGGIERLILLLSDRRTNRALVRAEGAALGDDFPVAGGAAIADLAQGRLPAGNAVILM